MKDEDPESKSAGAFALVDEIERLAYSYWEQEGRPEGRHLDHWLRAQAEVDAATQLNGNENNENPS